MLFGRKMHIYIYIAPPMIYDAMRPACPNCPIYPSCPIYPNGPQSLRRGLLRQDNFVAKAA